MESFNLDELFERSQKEIEESGIFEKVDTLGSVYLPAKISHNVFDSKTIRWNINNKFQMVFLAMVAQFFNSRRGLKSIELPTNELCKLMDVEPIEKMSSTHFKVLASRFEAFVKEGCFTALSPSKKQFVYIPVASYASISRTKTRLIINPVFYGIINAEDEGKQLWHLMVRPRMLQMLANKYHQLLYSYFRLWVGNGTVRIRMESLYDMFGIGAERPEPQCADDLFPRSKSRGRRSSSGKAGASFTGSTNGMSLFKTRVLGIRKPKGWKDEGPESEMWENIEGGTLDVICNKTEIEAHAAVFRVKKSQEKKGEQPSSAADQDDKKESKYEHWIIFQLKEDARKKVVLDKEERKNLPTELEEDTIPFIFDDDDDPPTEIFVEPVASSAPILSDPSKEEKIMEWWFNFKRVHDFLSGIKMPKKAVNSRSYIELACIMYYPENFEELKSWLLENSGKEMTQAKLWENAMDNLRPKHDWRSISERFWSSFRRLYEMRSKEGGRIDDSGMRRIASDLAKFDAPLEALFKALQNISGSPKDPVGLVRSLIAAQL